MPARIVTLGVASALVLLTVTAACSSGEEPRPPQANQRVYGGGGWYVSVPSSPVLPEQPAPVWLRARQGGQLTLEISAAGDPNTPRMFPVTPDGRDKWVLAPIPRSTFGAIGYYQVRLLDEGGAVRAEAGFDTARRDPGGGGTFDGSRFITSKRDRLAICVDVAGATRAAPAPLQTSAAASVHAVLDDLAANSRDWAAASLSSPTPVVDVGCPVGPALYDPNAGPTKGPRLSVMWGRTVREGSYYKAFVFVVPDADVQEAIGESRWRLTTEEKTCSLDNCKEVTVGVYIGESEVSDIQLLRENLGLAVGVRQ